MKLTIDRDAIVAALNRCNFVTDKRTSTPFAGKTRLTAKRDGLAVSLTYYATVLTLDVRGSLDPIDLTAEGDYVVNTESALRAVSAMPAGAVSLSVDKEILTIKSGKRKFDIVVLSPDDAPAVAAPGGKPRLFRGATIATLIKRVQHAMSVEENEMNGVLIRHQGTKTEAFATDMRVVGIMREETGAGDEFKAQLPTSALPVILATLATEDAVGIAVTDSRIFLTHGKVTVSAARREKEKLSETDFGAWVAQNENGAHVTVDSKALAEAAGVCGAGVAQLRLSATAEALGLRGKSGTAIAEDEIACKSDGEAVARIDPKRFAAALRDVSGEVQMTVGSPIVVLRSGEYLCALAIMRSDESEP